MEPHVDYHRGRRGSLWDPDAPTEPRRRATALLLDLGEKRSRRSIIDIRDAGEITPLLHLHPPQDEYLAIPTTEPSISRNRRRKRRKEIECLQGLSQAPAILLACLLNLMIGIPFGVSYFPVGWQDFPVQNRVAMGLRMFLSSTVIGQIVLTFTSKFKNPIALQMVENVPFYHALAYICIEEQGMGTEALSTLIVLFGLSSLLVGGVFYLLGKLEYGRVVYFFPTHVLVGCIGGIGIFISITALEVTIDADLKVLDPSSWTALWTDWYLVIVVFGLEVSLRLLDWATHDSSGRPRFPLLAPVYFCLVTPFFYLALWIFRIPVSAAQEAGYFFPAAAEACTDAQNCASGGESSSSLFDDLWVEWGILDLSSVSPSVIVKSIPTLIALAAFSLIHVPINIPAFAISTDVDTDMNAELIAHGWSNALAGVVGGLQNYMTYSNSVLYAKSGGSGKISSITVAAITCALYVFGPPIAMYIPRCMAGTLLFHIGIDLFLEGVVDSIGNFDVIEYVFIWVIAVTMTVYGMEAALIAGIIAALSTYAAQSIVYHSPIRGSMTAETLRSSVWNRSNAARAILNDPHRGRKRILILQLQGHLFFGNVAQITDTLKEILDKKKGSAEEPLVVIMDFTLVVGMDSSAAHAIAKLKKIMHRTFDVEVSIFVTGSGEGFPCQYALAHELSKSHNGEEDNLMDWNDVSEEMTSVGTHRSSSILPDHCISRGSISISAGSPILAAVPRVRERVCENLDEALIFAEDILLARANAIVHRREQIASLHHIDTDLDIALTPEEEVLHAAKYLQNLCPLAQESEIKKLLSYFRREEYVENDIIWNHGDVSTSAKLLVFGNLTSHLEGTETTENVRHGNMFGELGLVHGTERLSTVVCTSEKAVMFSLAQEAWTALVDREPRLARLIDGIVIRYLAHRCFHVSNRVFETRCLPI